MNEKIRFGKYKDQDISFVPTDYLRFLIQRNHESNRTLQTELIRRSGHRFHIGTSKLQGNIEMTKIKKILTGGQTGVDQAALISANTMEIETGGFAPEYFITEDGPAEWLKDFNLESGGKYRDEYGYNIPDADGALILGINNGGSRIVASVCGLYGKPWIHVYWKGSGSWERDPWSVVKWAHEHSIKTLLIAGNKESKNPGIGEAAADFLMEFFQSVNNASNERNNDWIGQ
jgi:hypothetical protein